VFSLGASLERDYRARTHKIAIDSYLIQCPL
jgi:hypothetical protein